MNQTLKIVIVIALVISAITVLTIKPNDTVKTDYSVKPHIAISKGIPMLLELGSDQCVPCKEMAPILEELKGEYAGIFQVEFFDTRKEPAFKQIYNIEYIPTQILFDASGEELFRHVGVYPKEDILAKWKDLGIDLELAE